MSFTVIVKTVPGGTEEINLESSTTVERCIQLAKVERPDQWTPKIGGETVALSKQISGDTTIHLIRKEIKGNDIL